MSEIKHTPGPWSASLGGTISQDAHPSYLVAEAFCGKIGSQQANARLIVAAPDLLALLTELVDIEGPCPGTASWAEKVRAAIAKARGAA